MENTEKKCIKKENCEIITRKRGNYEFSAYCPQFKLMVKSSDMDIAVKKLDLLIDEKLISAELLDTDDENNIVIENEDVK